MNEKAKVEAIIMNDVKRMMDHELDEHTIITDIDESIALRELNELRKPYFDWTGRVDNKLVFQATITRTLFGRKITLCTDKYTGTVHMNGTEWHMFMKVVDSTIKSYTIELLKKIAGITK